MHEKTSGCIPVTEVEETTVVIWVLILKAQVRPAAQTVISYTQLLGHRGLSGFPTWKAKCTERWKDTKSRGHKCEIVAALKNQCFDLEINKK